MSSLQLYRPFRGISAWFSTSVEPSIKNLWEHYGGMVATPSEAEFCISDDCLAQDTVEIQASLRETVLVQSSWLKEVIQHRCVVHDVVVGKHLLLPPHLTLQDTPTNVSAAMGSHSNQPQTPPPTPVRKCAADIVSSRKTTSKRPRRREAIPDHNCMRKVWKRLEKQLRATDLNTIVTLDELKMDTKEVQLMDFNPTHPDCTLKYIYQT